MWRWPDARPISVGRVLDVSRGRVPSSSAGPPRGEPIVVRDIRLEREGSDVVLSSRLRAPGLDLPPALWYRVAAKHAPFLGVAFDPFVPPLLMVGMRHQRDVVIEGDVSAGLLAATGAIMEVIQGWSGEADQKMKKVRLAAGGAVRERQGTKSGLFYSGGVDSSFVLLRNLRRYPPSDARSISHLIIVHGLDLRLDQVDLFRAALDRVQGVGRALGETVLAVTTNVKQVMCDVDWGHYACGPAMISAGLALGGLFHTIFVAASYTYNHLERWGSHPALDPLWSTEGTEFVYEAGEVERPDKIRFVATEPAILRALRVCWENREGAYNCGRCEKCLRTMFDLSLCGALEEAQQFPSSIDPAEVARLEISSHVRFFWLGILEQAKAAGVMPELVRAVERALERGAWIESRLGRLDQRLWQLASLVGVSAASVKKIDQAVFRGAMTSWLHRWQGRTERRRSH